ncbi:MAG: tol-pal system YbgF family protein, partial [Thermodesulfobacteriota bacterium]
MLRSNGYTYRHGDKLFAGYPLSVFIVFLIILVTACSGESASELFERGELLLGEGEYREALDVYRSLADDYPESSYAPSAKYRVGMIHYLHIGNLKMALDTYLSLILLYPESKEIALARQDMAEIYARNGEHRKAIGEYQWLVEHSRGAKRDTYRYNIAMEYQKLSDFKQAIIELQDVLKNSPSATLLPNLYYQIGNNQYLDGNMDE